MDLNKLKEIKQNETVRSIIDFFTKLERQESNETLLDSFNIYLRKLGYTIEKRDYFNFFADLEYAEVGHLDEVNGQVASKFVWDYPIKEVIKALLSPAPVKKRGRPKGSTNRPKLTSKTITRHKLEDKPDTKSVYFIFTTSRGQAVTLSLHDADLLLGQLELIKKTL